MSIKPLRQLLGLNSVFKHINEVAKNNKKITNPSRFQAIKATFDIKTHMTTINH